MLCASIAGLELTFKLPSGDRQPQKIEHKLRQPTSSKPEAMLLQAQAEARELNFPANVLLFMIGRPAAQPR